MHRKSILLKKCISISCVMEILSELDNQPARYRDRYAERQWNNHPQIFFNNK